MKKCLIVMIILLCIVGVAHADSIDNTAQKNDQSILSINPSSLYIANGKKSKLVPTYDQSVYGKSVKYSWASSDNNIAAINNGIIQAKAPGNAVITCTATFNDGTATFQTASITVFQPVESFSTKYTRLTVFAGQTLKSIETTIKPNNATFKEILWTSSDSSIASVDNTGSITGVSTGKVTIIGSLNEPEVKSQKRIKVQVTVTQSVSGITLSADNLTVGKGKTQKIIATILPDNASNKNIVWSSSNEKVATVKNGIVTGKNTGECTITAKAADGSDAICTCAISVIQYVNSVDAYADKLYVHVGETIYCGGAKALPEDAKIRRVVWSSDDSGCVSVTQGGSITGLAIGTCKIYASSIDGSDKKDSVTVYVEPANPITLESIGFGIYQYNLLALTVKNLCQYRRIKDFHFDMTMYNFTGGIVNSGSFSLGKPVSIGVKSKQTIKRDVYGVGQAYKIAITITSVTFADWGEYTIPKEVRETWTFTR